MGVEGPYTLAQTHKEQALAERRHELRFLMAGFARAGHRGG